jgi:hypothetical protein
MYSCVSDDDVKHDSPTTTDSDSEPEQVGLGFAIGNESPSDSSSDDDAPIRKRIRKPGHRFRKFDANAAKVWLERIYTKDGIIALCVAHGVRVSSTMTKDWIVDRLIRKRGKHVYDAVAIE